VYVQIHLIIHYIYIHICTYMHTMRSVELVDTNYLSMGVWYKTQERGETLLTAANLDTRAAASVRGCGTMCC
jgi:hypothetical protein